MREPGEDDPDADEEDWATPGGKVAFVRDKLAAGWSEVQIEHALNERDERDKRARRPPPRSFYDPDEGKE